MVQRRGWVAFGGGAAFGMMPLARARVARPGGFDVAVSGAFLTACAFFTGWGLLLFSGLGQVVQRRAVVVDPYV